MPAVSGRGLARNVYVVSAILLGLSLLAVHRADREVAHYAETLPGGRPAVVYEPGPPRRWGERPPSDVRHPVVVLAHGYAANKGAVAVLARRLARAGFGVVTFDFRGHGANRTPLRSGPRESLDEDLDAAVSYAATRAGFDPERLILMGHSMGGDAVLGYASRWPGASAVVSISGVREPGGPYALPNTLLVWGERVPGWLRARGRALGAKLARLERLRLDRTYGDPERGEAVRISEVPGVSHLGILYSREAAQGIVTWLRDTAGGTGGEPARDGRLAWMALGLLAAGVLLFGAPRLVAPLLLPGARDEALRPVLPLLALGAAHAAALVGVAAADPETGRAALGILPLEVAGEMLAFLLVSGLVLLVLLRVRAAPLPPAFPRGRPVLAAAGIALVGYLLLTAVLAPVWDVRLAPHRLGWAGVGAILALPFFLTIETCLRGGGRAGLWVGPAGKLLTLLALAIGAWAGLLPPFVAMTLGPLLLAFVLFELVALRLARLTPDPWPAALVQTLWVGWLAAALFPLA